MENLQSVEQFQQLKNGDATLFVFSADWCGDCRFIDPFMPEVEEKFTNYTFVKVDRDAFIDLCIELDVFGIPSFVAYKKGEEIGRFVSKDRKTQEEIESFIAGLN
ncbi:thioredoxin family protein [Lysinibacillus sp. KU-BSD001]|uniref:thioredoxin family protein n=1 Tax=Lysinibacillus sp. KU-BSD001 TaxID=3141328 RepID=UPI0036E98070